VLIEKKLIVVIKFKKRDVECIVDTHRRWKIELISTFPYLCQNFEGSDFLVVQFLAWPCRSYVSWQ